MEVKFYTFTKKPNSTKQPDANSELLTVDCTLKNGCSVLTPQLVLALDELEETGEYSTPMSNPSAYNYCYIADFGRYYFITDWTAVTNMWVCSMSVDVLASYKTAIGASTLYILRSSDLNAVNGNISDAVYPTTAIPTMQTASITMPWNYSATGSYVIGCTSAGLMVPGLLAGTTRYVACNDTSMRKLADMLTSDSWFADNTSMLSGNLDSATFKAIFNPAQYLHSIMWFPFTVPAGTYSSGSMYLGWYKVVSKDADNDISYDGLNSKSATYTATVTLPKHPDAATRGAYLNSAPYTEYSLNIPPFGTISLDASQCASLSSVYLSITVDFFTGLADVYVYDSSSKLRLLGITTGQLGIPVTLNQISVDHAAEALNNRMMRYAQFSGALGAASSVAGAAGAIASGNAVQGVLGAGLGIAGSVVGTAQAIDKGIYNGLKLSAAHIDSAGSTGSWLYLNKSWRIDAIFHRPVAEDLAHHGRPVCALKTINTIPGYVEVQDGDCALSCTNAERAQVKAHLEAGCFYE